MVTLPNVSSSLEVGACSRCQHFAQFHAKPGSGPQYFFPPFLGLHFPLWGGVGMNVRIWVNTREYIMIALVSVIRRLCI